MGKYRVKETVAVLHGNKVTVHHPSDEFVNLNDDSAKDLGENVEQVGKDAEGADQPSKDDETEVPADTADTQAANASRGARGKARSS